MTGRPASRSSSDCARPATSVPEALFPAPEGRRYEKGRIFKWLSRNGFLGLTVTFCTKRTITPSQARTRF